METTKYPNGYMIKKKERTSKFLTNSGPEICLKLSRMQCIASLRA